MYRAEDERIPAAGDHPCVLRTQVDCDLGADLAGDGLVLDQQSDFRVQALRGRIDIVGADRSSTGAGQAARYDVASR